MPKSRAIAMIAALNRMMRAGLTEVYRVSEEVTDSGTFYLNPIYSTKPRETPVKPA